MTTPECKPDSLKPCEWTGHKDAYTEWKQAVETRLNDGADTMLALRYELAENTATTKKMSTDVEQTKSDTQELVALLNSFRGAMRVLEMIGALAKPLGYIIATVAAVYGLVSAVKGGGLPK